jgi:hypothetical protein
VSSPLKRALYTAIHGFHPAIARGVPVLALPELLDALEKEFSKFTLPSGGPVVDFGFLEDKWYQKVTHNTKLVENVDIFVRCP